MLERFLWLQVIYGGCLLWLQVDDGFVEDKYSETYANLSQRRPAFLDVAMLEVRTYILHWNGWSARGLFLVHCSEEPGSGVAPLISGPSVLFAYLAAFGEL